jgi:antitoxin VapB
MGKEHRAKSFKSGNSVAIRMPAALGVVPDKEWTVIEHNGEYVIRAVTAPRRKFNIDKVWGWAIGSGLEPIKPGHRDFEVRQLLWDDPQWRAKHIPDA